MKQSILGCRYVHIGTANDRMGTVYRKDCTYNMSIRINGVTYYQTAEACRIARTSKNTFLRWVKEGKFPDVVYKDRNGWRLFTEDDLNRLKAEVNRIHKNQIPK